MPLSEAEMMGGSQAKAPQGGITEEEMMGKPSKSEPAQPVSADPGFFMKAGQALWENAKQATANPLGELKAGAKVGVGAVTGLGESAIKGVTGLAAMGIHDIVTKSMDTQGFDSGKAAAEHYIQKTHDWMAALTGINMAPQGKTEEALAKVISLIPEGITAAGDTVYEKTGSALAGASTQGLLTLLTLRGDLAAKGLESMIPKRGGNVAAGKTVGNAFDELIVTDPDKAQSLVNHVQAADPKLAKYMKAKIDKFVSASDNELEEIGRRRAEETVDHQLSPPNLEDITKRLPQPKRETVPYKYEARKPGVKPEPVRSAGDTFLQRKVDPPVGKPITPKPLNRGEAALRAPTLTMEQASSNIRDTVRQAYKVLSEKDLPCRV